MDEMDAGMSVWDKAAALRDAFPAAYWQALAVVMALYLVGGWAGPGCSDGQGETCKGGRTSFLRPASVHQSFSRCGLTLCRWHCSSSCGRLCTPCPMHTPPLQARFDVAFITLHASAVCSCGRDAGMSCGGLAA